jgi:succinate dehydrogenase / fumarate reductase membrane anchor subunit
MVVFMSRGLQGFNPWLMQRLTALLLVAGSIALIAVVLWAPFDDFSGFRGWIADPLVIIVISLFVASLLLHAWVGIRDVIMDYVRHLGVRITLLTLTVLYLLGCLVWLLWILL